jgi:hypothetical protein
MTFSINLANSHFTNLQKQKASRGREACLALDILLCFLGQYHPRPALRRAIKEAKEIPVISASQVMHFDLHPEMIATMAEVCQQVLFRLLLWF